MKSEETAHENLKKALRFFEAGVELIHKEQDDGGVVDFDDFSRYLKNQVEARYRRADWERAQYAMQLADIDERSAFLLSQHDPIAELGLDREAVRVILRFVFHGDRNRLKREVKEHLAK